MNTGPTLHKHKHTLPDAGTDICTDKYENVYSHMLYINMYKYTQIYTYVCIYTLSFTNVYIVNGCIKIPSSFLEDSSIRALNFTL